MQINFPPWKNNFKEWNLPENWMMTWQSLSCQFGICLAPGTAQWLILAWPPHQILFCQAWQHRQCHHLHQLPSHSEERCPHQERNACKSETKSFLEWIWMTTYWHRQLLPHMGSICIWKYKIVFENTKYSIFKSILNTFFEKYLYLYFKYFWKYCIWYFQILFCIFKYKYSIFKSILNTFFEKYLYLYFKYFFLAKVFEN